MYSKLIYFLQFSSKISVTIFEVIKFTTKKSKLIQPQNLFYHELGIKDHAVFMIPYSKLCNKSVTSYVQVKFISTIDGFRLRVRTHSIPLDSNIWTSSCAFEGWRKLCCNKSLNVGAAYTVLKIFTKW